jgi:hypothetical protein
MKPEFKSKWQTILWEHERESLLRLSNLPKQLNPDAVTTYIKQNKLRHKLGSNILFWLIFIWTPLIGATISGVYAWLICTQQLYLFILVNLPQLFLIVCIFYGLVFFNGARENDIRTIFLKPIYWFSFAIACYCHLPFLLFLKVRQLQFKTSLRYRKSFLCAFWRNPPNDLIRSKPIEYSNKFDMFLLRIHSDKILSNIELQENGFPSLHQQSSISPSKYYETLQSYLLPRIELLTFYIPRFGLMWLGYSVYVIIASIISA